MRRILAESGLTPSAVQKDARHLQVEQIENERVCARKPHDGQLG